MDHKKLSLSSLIVALILFLFPWFEVTCGDEPMATQSGFQTMSGGSSLSEEFEKQLDVKPKAEQGLDGSFLVVLAFLAVLGGIACWASGMLGKTPLDQYAPKLALAAFAFTLLQWIVGFPIQDEFAEFDEGFEKGGAAMKELGSTIGFERPELHTKLWFFLALAAMAGGASEQVTFAARRAKQKIDEKRSAAAPPGA